MIRGLCAALAAALLFPAAVAARTDAGWQVSLQWPADGTITSPFGRDGYRWHPGLDIGILRSLDVRAAAEGVVTLAGYLPGYDGYGAIVAVQHQGGLSRPLVRPGQQVRTGQLLGIAGCTGWCTGTHLHFELRYEGLPVDPTLLIVG
jgi:murein DD-endopeptidase MepM/ murein hydrolase activator NlpD